MTIRLPLKAEASGIRDSADVLFRCLSGVPVQRRIRKQRIGLRDVKPATCASRYVGVETRRVETIWQLISKIDGHATRDSQMTGAGPFLRERPKQVNAIGAACGLSWSGLFPAPFLSLLPCLLPLCMPNGRLPLRRSAAFLHEPSAAWSEWEGRSRPDVRRPNVRRRGLQHPRDLRSRVRVSPVVARKLPRSVLKDTLRRSRLVQ